jgi:hypothetical protein
VQRIEQLAEMYNDDAFAEEWERDQRPSRARTPEPRTEPIDLVGIRAAAAADGAREPGRRLVVFARAEALLVMGNAEQARALVSPLIWPEETRPDGDTR